MVQISNSISQLQEKNWSAAHTCRRTGKLHGDGCGGGVCNRYSSVPRSHQLTSYGQSSTLRYGPSIQVQALAVLSGMSSELNGGLQGRCRRGSCQQTNAAGAAAAATGAATAVPASVPASVQQLLGNPVIVAGFWGWFWAQFAKIFTRKLNTGKWDLRAFVDSGGMPSSHSSLCMAVTTALAVTYGFGSAAFATALFFSLIVMYDATGVRRHAGLQAQALNIVIRELLQGHEVSKSQLKEVLGHSPLQVFVGATLGTTVAILTLCVGA